MSGVSVCGRFFSEEDLVRIRELIGKDPLPSRRQISRQTCEVLGWLRPNGGLKEMSCRVALLKLEDLGLIKLPPALKRGGNKKSYRPTATIVEPAESREYTIGELVGLRLRVVESRADSQLWNEAVSRFHYLGYRRLAGAQIRYLIEASVGLIGVVGFGASAWKIGPRDRWIGWSQEQRKGRLHLVVNNTRFLILPWIRTRNLASWTLSRCARYLPEQWQQRYGYRPLLLETFVERERFAGTCYKAANWVYVGDTQGRGKLDRHHGRALPVKQIYVKPLAADFRRLLCA